MAASKSTRLEAVRGISSMKRSGSFPASLAGDDHPVDVVDGSLNRAQALVRVLECYAIQGDVDDHNIEITDGDLALIVGCIDDYLIVAKGALKHLSAKGVS